MAFECDESGCLSSKNSVDYIDKPLEKESSLTRFEPHIPGVFSRIGSKKESLKFVKLKPSSEFHHKKGVTTSDNPKLSSSDDSDVSNSRRSMTDLPPVLVSEILHCLDAKELGIVSCVSTLLHRLVSDHHGWKDFYCERWGLPLGSAPSGSEFSDERTWKERFIEREIRSRSFMGRYSIDVLYGHTEAVRAVFLLSSAKLLFTGGYDSIMRMWDVEEGFAIASSHPLGCTIRAIAADAKLLVAGGTDGFIQGWRAMEELPHLFDLSDCHNQHSEFRLWDHQGPVTCIALDPTRIYSGSWDNTVRVWDRSLLKCLMVLRHSDWIWGLAPRGSTVAISAGRDVYIWDIDSGDQINIIQNVHVGNTFCVARSHTGNLLFTGGEDGAIHMFELTNLCTDSKFSKVATWTPHTDSVHSLAFEFPWLVSVSGDGKIALIDVRKLLRTKQRPPPKYIARANRLGLASVEAPQRMLQGFGCNLFAVDIGLDRIFCSGENGVVRIWNFSQALEIEQRVRALRSIRLENRMRRRKVQIEMNRKDGQVDHCSVAAKKNQMNSTRNGSWHGRRGVHGKLKA